MERRTDSCLIPAPDVVTRLCESLFVQLFPVCHVHHDAASLRSSCTSLTICQLSLCLRCTRTAGSSLEHYRSDKDQSSHTLLAHASSSSLAANCDVTRRRDIPCNIQRVYCTVISLADSRPFIVRQPSLAVRGSKSSRKKKDERQKRHAARKYAKLLHWPNPKLLVPYVLLLNSC